MPLTLRQQQLIQAFRWFTSRDQDTHPYDGTPQYDGVRRSGRTTAWLLAHIDLAIRTPRTWIHVGLEPGQEQLTFITSLRDQLSRIGIVEVRFDHRTLWIRYVPEEHAGLVERGVDLSPSNPMGSLQGLRYDAADGWLAATSALTVAGFNGVEEPNPELIAFLRGWARAHVDYAIQRPEQWIQVQGHAMFNSNVVELNPWFALEAALEEQGRLGRKFSRSNWGFANARIRADGDYQGAINPTILFAPPAPQDYVFLNLTTPEPPPEPPVSLEACSTDLLLEF